MLYKCSCFVNLPSCHCFTVEFIILLTLLLNTDFMAYCMLCYAGCPPKHAPHLCHCCGGNVSSLFFLLMQLRRISFSLEFETLFESIWEVNLTTFSRFEEGVMVFFCYKLTILLTLSKFRKTSNTMLKQIFTWFWHFWRTRSLLCLKQPFILKTRPTILSWSLIMELYKNSTILKLQLLHSNHSNRHNFGTPCSFHYCYSCYGHTVVVM